MAHNVAHNVTRNVARNIGFGVCVLVALRVMWVPGLTQTRSVPIPRCNVYVIMCCATVVVPKRLVVILVALVENAR